MWLSTSLYILVANKQFSILQVEMLLKYLIWYIRGVSSRSMACAKEQSPWWVCSTDNRPGPLLNRSCTPKCSINIVNSFSKFWLDLRGLCTHAQGGTSFLQWSNKFRFALWVWTRICLVFFNLKARDPKTLGIYEFHILGLHTGVFHCIALALQWHAFQCWSTLSLGVKPNLGLHCWAAKRREVSHWCHVWQHLQSLCLFSFLL